MKKYTILSLILILSLTLCGCTVNYEQENETETQLLIEEETEKESLIPLLVSDEENELYLYGIKPDGVVLYADGIGHYYDWAYSFSDYREPRIYKGHFDNDRNEDIAIVTYTNENVEDIRIISDGDFDEDSVYTVDPDEFNSYVRKAVVHSYDDVNETVTFTVDGRNYVFDLSESFEKLVFDGISYSRNVSYELIDGKIFAYIVPVVVSSDGENDYGIAEMGITIKAQLLFDGYNISLTDFIVEGL